MWRGFMGWCLAQSPTVTLESLDVRDLQAFQAARFGMKSADLSLTPRHALRLLRLIDRVLRHHAARSDNPPNTAASDWLAENPHVRYAEAASGDPLPEYLSVAEAKHLIAFLSNARPRPGVSRRTSECPCCFHLAGASQSCCSRAASGRRADTCGGTRAHAGFAHRAGRPHSGSALENLDPRNRGLAGARDADRALGRRASAALASGSRGTRDSGQRAFSVDCGGQTLEQAVPLLDNKATACGSRSRWQRRRNLQAAPHVRDAAIATRNIACGSRTLARG